MEIIERGELPEEREFTTRCGYCKTLFKFKQNEGKIKDGFRDVAYIEVKCPLCGKEVTADL